MEFEEEVAWDFEGGWEAEFDDDEYNFSLGVMTGAALLLLVLAWAAKRVTRWMGALMVLSYAAYLATLVVLAS